MTPFSKIAVFILLALTAGGVMYLFYSMTNSKSLPVLGEPGREITSFSFRNQNGETITEKDLNDRIVIAEYFFTTCPGICKQMSKNLKTVYNEFKSSNDVVIFSHTVDPERDSVATLKNYAEQLGAEATHWQFLTGNKDSLYTTARQFYLLAADAGPASADSEFIHTQYVCLLDKRQRIRGFYDATNTEEMHKLSEDIVRLQKSYDASK